MNDKPNFKRRNYFIKKKFQTSFALKFLIIIIVTVIAASGLFLYNMKGTMTIGYRGSMVDLDYSTGYFLPWLLTSTFSIIIVMGLIATSVLVFISHRFAGPLFRFESILTEIERGNLTLKFDLRGNDQFTELADRINQLTTTMNRKVGDIKKQTAEITTLVSDLKAHPSLNNKLEQPLEEITVKIKRLQDSVNFYKTSLS